MFFEINIPAVQDQILWYKKSHYCWLPYPFCPWVVSKCWLLCTTWITLVLKKRERKENQSRLSSNPSKPPVWNCWCLQTSVPKVALAEGARLPPPTRRPHRQAGCGARPSQAAATRRRTCMCSASPKYTSLAGSGLFTWCTLLPRGACTFGEASSPQAVAKARAVSVRVIARMTV